MLVRNNAIYEYGKTSLPGGLEPPTFRLTVERANQLRHGSCTWSGMLAYSQRQSIDVNIDPFPIPTRIS